jgi:hypothetical protein
MLSWSCRRFRARFSPGSAHPHRRACQECGAFATAIESAAGVRLPMPEGLRNRLRSIAVISEADPEAVLPFPVPRLPMPEALAGRLRSIAPPARPAPPEWVLNPRYAVAASALLALLLGPLFLIGADRGLEALGDAREEVVPILRHTEEEGREEIEKVRTGAAEAYDAARRSLARSSESLGVFTERLSAVVPDQLIVPDDFYNPDPEDEPDGSSRRPR